MVIGEPFVCGRLPLKKTLIGYNVAVGARSAVAPVDCPERMRDEPPSSRRVSCSRVQVLGNLDAKYTEKGSRYTVMHAYLACE